MRSACQAEANAAEEAPSSEPPSLAASSKSTVVAPPPPPPPPRSLSLPAPRPPPRVIEITLRERASASPEAARPSSAAATSSRRRRPEGDSRGESEGGREKVRTELPPSPLMLPCCSSSCSRCSCSCCLLGCCWRAACEPREVSATAAFVAAATEDEEGVPAAVAGAPPGPKSEEPRGRVPPLPLPPPPRPPPPPPPPPPASTSRAEEFAPSWPERRCRREGEGAKAEASGGRLKLPRRLCRRASSPAAAAASASPTTPATISATHQ